MTVLDDLPGFMVARQPLPTPLIDVSDGVRERMVHLLAALVGSSAACGRLPEDAAAYLAAGEFPADVAAHVELDRAEFDAWVDLLLVAQQTP